MKIIDRNEKVEDVIKERADKVPVVEKVIKNRAVVKIRGAQVRKISSTPQHHKKERIL
jgi:hypothetical protein